MHCFARQSVNSEQLHERRVKSITLTLHLDGILDMVVIFCRPRTKCAPVLCFIFFLICKLIGANDGDQR